MWRGCAGTSRTVATSDCRMKLRTTLAAASLLALVGLTACGGDDSSSSTTVAVPTDNTPVGTESPGSTNPPTGPGFEHPTGAGRGGDRGRLRRRVRRSGRRLQRHTEPARHRRRRGLPAGVTTLEYPGPLLRPVVRRTLDEAGIQPLLALADEHGLLAEPPEYPRTITSPTPPTPTSHHGRWHHVPPSGLRARHRRRGSR